jgi:arylsulfatase A-like enzyme
MESDGPTTLPKTDRRTLLRWLGGALGAAGLSRWLPLAGCAPSEERPPNVIVIMTDDQGYQDLGCYGSPDIATPRIDAMAAQGVRFTDFYAAPQCTAARVAAMTGSYAARAGGLKRTGTGTRVGLHDDEWTLPELLRARGYATHLVGKWHLGMDARFSPLRHGFDSFFGLLTSNGQRPPLMRGESIVEADPDQATLTERYTEESLRVIREAGSTPFFLLLAHVMPHVPLAVAPRWQGRSRRGPYGDAVECIDWSTGELFDALAETGQDHHTLVVFCSDNGPWLSKGPDGGSALPLRGGKGQVYEGGVRVPCIMRWPGRIPADTTSDAVCGLIDLLPTFAGLAGAALPDDRILDGRDIWPVASGESGAGSPHEHFYFFRGTELRAVRSGRWKLHRSAGPMRPKSALFDLASDIGETTNVAETHPDVVRTLERALADFASELEQTRRPPGRV